ncbi:MAG: hypothetical protein ACQEQI_05640 [Bacillota bacterium]
MNKKIAILLILILVLVGYNQNLEAKEDELLEFLDSLKGIEYDISNYQIYFEEYAKSDDRFAKQFYEDFLNGNVEFITPEYETDNLNDFKFQKHVKRYPGLVFKTGKVLNGGVLVDITEAHYNFKYYNIDIDNNKANGNEDVFYSSGYWNEEIIDDDGRYDLLNRLSKKEAPYFRYESYVDGFPIAAEYVGSEKKRTTNYNGLIKYQGRYYVYEVLNWNTRVAISFYCWNKKLSKVTCMVNYTIVLKEEE